ncbi:MAG: hypothetical protein ACKVQU_30955 [Burkholderiales bacterium]
MTNSTLPKPDQPGIPDIAQPVKAARKRTGRRATESAKAASKKVGKKAAAKFAAAKQRKSSTHRVEPATKAPVAPLDRNEAKAVAKSKPAKNDDHGKADKKNKPKDKEKDKLIRDSFTMPESEYGLFSAIKKRSLARGLSVKKSEVLRAAITLFAAQTDSVVVGALRAVEVLKTGRPPKNRK